MGTEELKNRMEKLGLSKNWFSKQLKNIENGYKRDSALEKDKEFLIKYVEFLEINTEFFKKLYLTPTLEHKPRKKR